MIKAFVFDFDGLILDTETMIYQASNALYEEHGETFPISTWGQLAGAKEDAFDLYTHFNEQTGSPLSREDFYKKRDTMVDQFLEKADVLPGVLTLIKEGKRAGLKIALATSSGNHWAKNHLERLGLLPFFDYIVQADDVNEVKPDPELFIKACEGVGVDPHEAVAFEDSYHGAVAAKRAGLYCVVVPNEVTRGLTFDEDVDLTLKALSDITYNDLIQRFS